jgi:hypothetical protein
MPNKKSSAIVATAENSSEPRQPNRFEKMKTMVGEPTGRVYSVWFSSSEPLDQVAHVPAPDTGDHKNDRYRR